MIIKEFLPNPVGSDKEGEYIKLFNDGNQSVSLDNWQIKDASGKLFKLNDVLPVGQELVLPYSKTNISLNNNGEKISLYDANGKLVDELSYTGQAREGEVIGRGKRIEKGKTITKQVTAIDNKTIPDTLTLNNNQSLNYPIIPRPKAGIPVTKSDLGTNYQLPISNIVFLDFLTAAILAALGVYIIVQLEKKLEINLF